MPAVIVACGAVQTPHLLLAHRGLKRWLLPPLILTTAVLIAGLFTLATFFDGLLERYLPGQFEFERAPGGWIRNLSERWEWFELSLVWLIGAAEWVVNALWGLLTSKPLKLLGWFLVGSLVTWYCFSIAYEALAGPFLDEIHARLETRWFGEDPRSRLERPNDIPAERCLRLTTWSALLASLLFLGAWFLLGSGPWWALALVPVSLVPALLTDRRYGPWLLWVARVEARAAWASLLASVVTGAILVFALPLYFVPLVGYPLFALVVGCATALGLLDIPFERRGWSLRQRLRFVFRHLPTLIAFGTTAGFLLAVPVIGPVLMVPSASIGGVWLLCRLDKGYARDRARSPLP